MRERTYGINIRVTLHEKKQIERRAKKCGLTLSEYLRQLAKGRKPQDLSNINFGGDEGDPTKPALWGEEQPRSGESFAENGKNDERSMM